MPTEESSLLGEQIQNQHVLPAEDIYDRFTRRQKRAILAIVALTGLVPMFIGSSFVPSIPQISKDLNETPANVSLGVSLSVLATSFGVMFWSGYASFYGKRMVYLCGMPFTILGSFATAVSTDLASFLVWRFVQTFGCSTSFAVGAAVIGDIYKVEERGAAMGTFLGAVLVGLAIAPPVGGVLAEFWSWRGFQASLGVWAIIQILLLALFLPETAHPGSRGVEKETNSGRGLVWINPLGCLTFLRSPNIVAVTLANTFGILSDLTLLVPIAYTLGAKYGISSEAIIGVLFLPSGAGNFLAAPFAGRMSDMAVRRGKAQRKGEWVPEDRLTAVCFGELVLIPISVTLVGLTTAYVGGTTGLAINLVCLFTNGVGVDLVITPIGTYVVDIIPSRSSEVNAAIVALRSVLLAPATALLIPSVQTIGVVATNCIAALLALFGYFLIWLTMQYGKEMRAFADVGYPNFDARASNNDNNAART